jgi:hypothetical protein
MFMALLSLGGMVWALPAHLSATTSTWSLPTSISIQMSYTSLASPDKII